MDSDSSYTNVSEKKLLSRVLDFFLNIVVVFFAADYPAFTYIDSHNSSILNWILLLAFYFIVFGEIFQLYDLKISGSKFRILKNLFFTSLMTTLAFVGTPYYAPSLPENRTQVIFLFVLIILPTLLWRLLYRAVLDAPKVFREILIIGHSSVIEDLLELTQNDFHNPIKNYLSEKQSKIHANYENIATANLYQLVKLNNINEVVISTKGLSSDVVSRINKDLFLLFEEGIKIRSTENFYEEVTSRVSKEYLDFSFYEDLCLSCNGEKRVYKLVHRTLDIVISTSGLLIFILLLPFIFTINILANNGPLFYTQLRVGQNGQRFKIFKLRSMVVDAELNGAVYAQQNDIRVTKFGKFLRKSRLDEVPQFFNILKGDMSVIGPRPERPEFVRNLEKKIPLYVIRHLVKPGLTGWAQVKYPYARTLIDQEIKFRYDLYYIKQQSIFLDFKIIIKTIATVLFFRGQ